MKKKKKDLLKYVVRHVWAGTVGLRQYQWVDKWG